MNQILTISIPVYNDHELLLKQLKLINNQYVPTVVVNIYDNCSLPDVSDFLTVNFPECLEWVKIVRNTYNIGADGNIFSCFQNCKTEWLWILSVNDGISDDAISSILGEIQEYRNAVYINFPGIKKTITTHGYRDFCENLPSYARSFFISVCIYNVPKLEKYYPYYQEFISSNNGQLIVLLKSLEKSLVDELCVFSAKNILTFETPAAWRRSSFIVRSMLIFDAFSGDSKRIFLSSLGKSILHLLLYYNCSARLAGEISMKEQIRNFINFMLTGDFHLLLDRVTYKLIFINLITIFFPSFYRLYLNKKS